ncbi:hypothetical protein [Herbiconiux sp. UC225_62]|uniref:hypothetical protein n=1 Tax=Herbiconiux sp. UC225_62 TaxID=3350168 RepID=UPI0036D2105C
MSETERDGLLRVLRIRPYWLAEDAPDPADDEYWELPEAISQRYYDGGAEVNIAALVDLVLASDWLTRVKAEAAAEALEASASDIDAHFQDLPSWLDSYRAGERTQEWMTGASRMVNDAIARIHARAAEIREQVK